MAKLPRPHIPLTTKLRVACHGLGDLFPDDVIAAAKEAHALRDLLTDRLGRLAALLECEAKDLRLDHAPALVNREKLVELPDGNKIWTIVVPSGGRVLEYRPAASDPEYLVYRSRAAHDVKTRIRGDGAQLSDLALARKEKRRIKKKKPKRSGTGKAKIRSANRWPPKGSRRVNWRQA
ncbi:MAG: hypothetical protein KGL39_06305 [Patescibacteria group bacterium]|nr:hypothetical protein [Patescibacteria group bacterium]